MKIKLQNTYTSKFCNILHVLPVTFINIIMNKSCDIYAWLSKEKRKIAYVMIVQITMQTNQARMYEIPALYRQTPCLDRFYPFQFIKKDFKMICLVYCFQGNPCCPVNSFTKYTNKLNPSDSNLNECMKQSLFGMTTMSRNTMAKTMLNISKDAELPVIYTNYCICATSITHFDQRGVLKTLMIHDILGKTPHIQCPEQIIDFQVFEK